ncbi:MAG: hypothetical protein K9K38_02865 [Rhodoferax sp.]|nr:hypothetical protein [Rhodoferax sp.]
MTRLQTVLAVMAIVGLVACQASPSARVSSNPPKSTLHFADLQGFDRDLADSLSTRLPKVEVAFYDRITPSSIPQRLQLWMSSVEAGGGSVTVVEPNSRLTAKSPFLLISAISTLWTASKLVRDISTEAQFKAAQGFDAQILLKQDDKGDSVVDKVVFTHRK